MEVSIDSCNIIQRVDDDKVMKVTLALPSDEQNVTATSAFQNRQINSIVPAYRANETTPIIFGE
jgi:hypothetical protein